MGSDDYFGEYYREHGGRIRERLRSRYHEDEGYRKRKIAQALRRHARLAPLRAAMSRARVILGKRNARLIGTPDARNYDRVITVRGRQIRVVSHLALSVIAKVPRGRIDGWLRQGVIPAPTYVDQAGRRWYSEKYSGALAARVAQGAPPTKEAPLRIRERRA